MIIADTGLWLALALPRDRHHALAEQRIADIAAQQERIIITCAVMTETCQLLLARGGVASQLRLVRQL